MSLLPVAIASQNKFPWPGREKTKPKREINKAAIEREKKTETDQLIEVSAAVSACVNQPSRNRPPDRNKEKTGKQLDNPDPADRDKSIDRREQRKPVVVQSTNLINWDTTDGGIRIRRPPWNPPSDQSTPPPGTSTDALPADSRRGRE